VDGVPELPIDWMKGDAEIDVPNSGLLFTSSDFDTFLPKTEIKLPDGQILRASDPILGFSQFSFDEIEVNGQRYKYRAWLVDPSCCIISSEDIEKFKADLITKIEAFEKSKN
jgi:hypothetical protein